VQAKACCAAAYDSDLVALVLGDAYHPGGAALTRRLAGHLSLAPGARALDVASGPGATALLLAREHGVTVDGVDLGEKNLARARTAARAAGLDGRVRFHPGDAERLPFGDGLFDAVVCECAFCTFPGKEAAAAEFARVLRPGGRLGITDVTLVPGRLDERLAGLAGWVACLADARPLEEYERLLAGAGLRVTRAERHDGALAAMIDQIEARLRALLMARRAAPSAPSPGVLAALDQIDAGTILEMTALAREAVSAGTLGYALLVAGKR
jgi:arsenite methyltransferase